MIAFGLYNAKAFRAHLLWLQHSST